MLVVCFTFFFHLVSDLSLPPSPPSPRPPSAPLPSIPLLLLSHYSKSLNFPEFYHFSQTRLFFPPVTADKSFAYINDIFY